MDNNIYFRESIYVYWFLMLLRYFCKIVGIRVIRLNGSLGDSKLVVFYLG